MIGEERKDIYFYDSMNENATQSETNSLVCADRKKSASNKVISKHCQD